MLKILKSFSKRVLRSIFRRRGDVKIGFYGPPNAGKTSLANRICKDWTGEEIGSISKVPHETRHVQFKEKVEIKYKGNVLTFKIVDTPGIATRIDYEDFLKFGIKKNEAKKRAKEATQGVIESIQWLEDMDAVIRKV
jgi:ribosome biogenesis GTPase A